MHQMNNKHKLYSRSYCVDYNMRDEVFVFTTDHGISFVVVDPYSGDMYKYVPTATGNCASLEVLDYVHSRYGDIKYHIESLYLHKVFHLLLDQWESNDYLQNDGTPVNHAEKIRELRHKGITKDNIVYAGVSSSNKKRELGDVLHSDMPVHNGVF